MNSKITFAVVSLFITFTSVPIWATHSQGHDEIARGGLVQEREDRIAADADLQAEIDAEETARMAADDDLQSAIDAETAARIAADANLQAQLGANLQVSVPAFAIISDGPEKALSYLPESIVHPYQTGNTLGFGAVQLPQGFATLGMTCVVRDSFDLAVIEVSLLRSPFDASLSFSIPEIIASFATSPDDSNNSFLEIVAPVDPDKAVIDNANFFYFLKVDFDLPEAASLRSLSFRGCTIALAP